MKRVCAVLVNYKGAADVALAVASVLADSPDTEVVVVDNSEDPAEADRLRDLLPSAVRLVVAPRNLGFGAGCNLGMATTTANLIWLVNPDVRVLPGCLATLQLALDADHSLVAVAPRQYLDMDKRWNLPPSWLPTALNSWAREAASRNPRARARYVRAARAEALRVWTAHPGAALRQRALSGGAMLVRRSSLPAGDEVFDPAFFMYFEDSDFCLRMRGRGLRLAVVPGADVVHLWQTSAHKDGLMAQAAPLYFKRHFSGSRWLAKAGELASMLPEWPAFSEVESGQSWHVPQAWQGGWVLELSLTPLLSPAAGLFGTGATLPWPGDVLAALGDATAYGRLGPANRVAEWQEHACQLLAFRPGQRTG